MQLFLVQRGITAALICYCIIFFIDLVADWGRLHLECWDVRSTAIQYIMFYKLKHRNADRYLQMKQILYLTWGSMQSCRYFVGICKSQELIEVASKVLKPQYTSKAVWERISCYLIACVDSSQWLSKLRAPETVTDSLTVYEYIHIKQKNKKSKIFIR